MAVSCPFLARMIAVMVNMSFSDSQMVGAARSTFSSRTARMPRVRRGSGANSICLPARLAYGHNNNGVRVINGKAFGGGGCSSDGSRNQWRAGSRIIPRERSRSSFRSPPAGRPISPARIVADIFSRHLGQKFVVENVGGAGGTVGALRAARAAADGYTILSGHLGTNALAPAFYPNLGYDPQKGFRADWTDGRISRNCWSSARTFPPIISRNSSPTRKPIRTSSMSEHAGLGSVSYIGCLLLHAAIGIKPTMVPFTGTAPVLNAMLGGQIDYECDPVLGTLSQVRAGNVKALAVAARKRSPLLPDVPTSHEQGLPEFDIARRFTRCSRRAARRRPVVEKLADALNKGLKRRGRCKSGWPSSAPISSSRAAADQRPSRTW